MLIEVGRTPSFHKVAACIGKYFRFANPNVGDFGFNVIHILKKIKG